jgi:hypothetical protein
MLSFSLTRLQEEPASPRACACPRSAHPHLPALASPLQLIYNYPEEIFADNGICAVEHADFVGIERLALVLGGEIVSTFDNPGDVKLGECKLVEEIMIGEDRLVHFSGVACGEACTIVLRGASSHLLDEAERSLHDALCVLQATVQVRPLPLPCSLILLAARRAVCAAGHRAGPSPALTLLPDPARCTTRCACCRPPCRSVPFP